MSPDYLGHFYEQEEVRKAVKAFMYETLDQEVLTRAYKEGDVSGYKEAREVVDAMFSRLHNLYAKEKSSSKENKAR